MSVSGSRAAVEINLEEFEKRLRAAGAQHIGAEDPLSELARLVETTRPAPAGTSARIAEAAPRPATPVREAANFQSARPPVAPQPDLDSAALRPALDEIDARDPEAGIEPPTVDAEDALEFRGAAAPAPRASRRWALTVSGLAIAGIGLLGAVFFFRGGIPALTGISKDAPFIAAAQGPTRVQPPSDATVAPPPEAAGALVKDTNPSTPVKIVTSEEQPIDLAAHAANAAAAAPADAASPSQGADGAMKGTVDTPVVVAASGPPQSVAPQFPDPKPVRTVSLRPDGTPIASAPVNVASATPVAAAPAAPPPDAKPPAPQASTPKVELPTKLNGKSSARVDVAKTDTTAPAADDGARADKPAKPAKTHEASAEPKAPAAAEPTDAAATTSGGWSVQLAAPRSEAEAKTTAAKLNEKYASALNGAPIGVHKASVRGDTIYRLRVSGLSKADAAALCARLKGEGGQCFIAK